MWTLCLVLVCASMQAVWAGEGDGCPCRGLTDVTKAEYTGTQPNGAISAQSGNVANGGTVALACEVVDVEEGVVFQNAIWYPSGLWPNAIVPYTFRSGDFDAAQLADIQEGIYTLDDATCVEFVPYDPAMHPNYIEIINGPGCRSTVGKFSSEADGRQELSLHHGGGTTCLGIGTVMHELLHALGFFHEQSRPDRDDFVCINLANVEEGREHNFDIQPLTLTLDTPYTYGSLLHYGWYFFNRDTDVPSMYTCDRAAMDVIGQGTMLHANDILRVNRLYQGMGSCPPWSP